MPHHFSQTTSTQRIAYGMLAGTVVFLLPLPFGFEARALLAWVVGVGVLLGLALWLAETFDAAQTRARALQQDASSVVLFVLLLVTGFASVAAIAQMLHHVKDLSLSDRAVYVALSMLALASSWLLIHTSFAFRYAHRYYQTADDDDAARAKPAKGGRPEKGEGPGLTFPGKEAPDYFDFLYHAMVVGMTSQVADVDVTSRAMRRLTLGHSLLSFAFNMVVLALSINVVAGAIQ
ncbi:DUF1345 domain-containing protein [Variovorax sp. HJSM1_2]|uniref:DUF1345 domain-containing protein n=1 Tax=Variovorax sp. HJSM1_2 TaxID=3366263 RepID=UPI003BD58714